MKKSIGIEPPDRAEADAAGEPFESMFRQARSDGFTPTEKERLWQGVSAGILAGRGPGGAPSAAAKASLGGLAGAGGKLAVVLLAGSAVVAAVLFGRSAGSPPTPSAKEAASARASASLSPPSDSSSPGGAPPVVTWDDLPRVHEAASAGAAAGLARSPRQRAESPAPPSHDPDTTPPGAVPPFPAPGAAPASASAAAPAETRVDEPTEGGLLLRARQKMNTDPAAAFLLTQEAARRFPDGALAPERDALAISALSAQGRTTEARARLAAFRARYPQSPQLPRLEEALAR